MAETRTLCRIEIAEEEGTSVLLRGKTLVVRHDIGAGPPEDVAKIFFALAGLVQSAGQGWGDLELRSADLEAKA